MPVQPDIVHGIAEHHMVAERADDELEPEYVVYF
jgi:hypothetical protein